MMLAFLFDVRPDPVGLPIGVFELILLAILALFFTAILIVGIVLVLKLRNRRLSVNAATSQSAGVGVPQPSQPNQL
jgi:hypothetical protein